MCSFAMFLSVDPSLGRVDYSLLSDQTLMEMLFEGFDHETKKVYQDNDGMYVDVCHWSGIKCDAHKRVIKIDVDRKKVNGSLELGYAPPKVKVLKISPFLKSKLTGSIDLTRLPGGIRILYLENNQLTGEIDLTHLPKGMKELFLENNELTREIDLTCLPERMEYLSLEKNQLTGEIDITHLPNGMRGIYLQTNKLSGSLVIKRLSPQITTIDVRGNRFNAIAVIESQTRAQIQLGGSGVKSVVDENGKKLDSKRFFR